MSDVDVTIQVTPELELGNLKSDLESALSGIESGLSKIKIQVDTQQALSDIQTLRSEIQSLGRDSVSEITPELERVAKAYKEISSTSSTGKASLSKELVADTKEYNNAIANVNKEIAKMENNLSAWSKIDGFTDANKTSIAQYEAELTKLKELKAKILSPSDTVTDKSFAKDMSAVKANVSGITPELERAAKAIKELQSAQSFTPFKEGMPGFSKMVSNIDEQISSIETKIADTIARSTQIFGEGGNKELDAEITKLEQFLTEYNSLQAKLADGTKKGGISKVGASDEYDKIAKGAKEATTAIDDYIRAVAGSKPANEDSFGLKQLKEAKDTLATMQNNLNKWGAAENGKSRDAYDAYRQQTEALEQLIQETEKGSVATDDLKQRFEDIKRAGKESADTIKANGEDMSSFSTKLSGMIQRFSFYFSMTRMVMMTIQKLKEMVKASMEIETAMARIQIVTGATDSQMASFFESASNQAKELGKNITDVAKSIETFSRLGYSLADATQLSKYANIMSNVGDTTVENATTGITSIIKGYGLNPSDAEHVSDVLINVGQKYAISAEELMEAFQRGGAALAASGTSFEESAALFAATNASLQNAATTGTLWKTVSARIRSAKTELEELGEDTTDLADGFSKYREELKALTGVDIMEDEDHYKSMLTIFNELAAVWDDLRSDEARSRVAEILGGTRNLSGIMSTIQNIKDAQNAYNDALNSTGVSMEANNIYMETTEAHVGQLKASFQELSVDVFNSDFMKGFVDGARAAIEAIDSLVDHIGVLGTTITGVLGGVAIAKGVSAFKSAFLGSTGIFASLSAEITAFIGGLSAMTLGITAGAIAAVAAAGVLIYKYKKEHSYEGIADKAKSSREDYQSSLSELEAIESELGQVKARMEELRSLGQLTITQENELNNLQDTCTQLEIERDLLIEINNLKGEQARDDAKNFFDTETDYKTGKYETKQFAYGEEFTVEKTEKVTPVERARDLNKRINDAKSELKSLQKEMSDSGDKLDEKTRNYYQKRAKSLQDRIDNLREEETSVLNDIKENYKTLFDSNGEVYEGFEKEANDVKNLLRDVKDYSTSNDNFSEYINNVTQKNQKALSEYNKLKAEFDALGVDENKTKFGNIDLNDRQVLKWNDSNLKKYKNEIESWGKTAEDFKGTISTVFAGDMDFDGLKIAFSPMLQTDKGAVLLSSDTVSQYISTLLDNVRSNSKDGNWTTEDLLKLDAKGIEIEGQKISGIIADVGETAGTTAEAMHYLGKDGALALAKSSEALKTMTAGQFEALYGRSSEAGQAVTELVKDAIDLGIISDSSGANVHKLAVSLSEAGVIGSESAASLEDFAEAAEESTDAMEALNKYNDAYTSAMSASTSATGLNTQQVKDLTDAYNHLDGFNPSILFEKTANGIHLNEEYLKKLNAQIENEKMTELWQNLENLEEQRAQMDANHEDTSKIDAEIESARQLIAQYEGLTSAYNKWQSAKSATKERDMYQNVGSAYEQMKETLDQGWYGDEELNAYLDMMLSASQRTGDAYEDFQKLDRKIEGTSHSLMDYWQYDDDKNLVTDGMFDFLDDVNKVFGDTYAKVDENGKYTWDLTNGKLDEVAEHFGTTTEMIQMFERALIDAGATVILDSQEIDDLQGNLQKLQQAGQISSDIDLGFEASEMSLEDIQAKIKELENEKVRIEAEADTGEADTALNQLDATIAALKNQEIAVKIQTQVANGHSVKDLLDMDDTTLSSTLEIDTSQVESAREMLNQLEAGVEAPVTIKIDEGQFAQLMGLGGEETMTVKAELDSSEPDAYKPEDKDATVKFKKDSSEPDSYQPSNKSAIVVYSADTSGLPNTLPTITRTVNYVATGAVGPGKAYGTLSVARANGTAYNAPWNFKSAYANGRVALNKDEVALVNELGTESIILICDFIQQCISNIYLIAGSSL